MLASVTTKQGLFRVLRGVKSKTQQNFVFSRVQKKKPRKIDDFRAAKIKPRKYGGLGVFCARRHLGVAIVRSLQLKYLFVLCA
jgi:hypothetical protein